MDELSANRGRQVAECPQVKVMRLEEKIAEQAAEIKGLKVAIADFISVWEDDEMPDEEWDSKLKSTRNRLKELKGG
jgi:hypothetical protein